MWFNKIPFSFNPKYFLLPEIEALDQGKGVQFDKFKTEWRELIGILKSYITCEGRFDLVFKYHISFLQHLNQQSKMNFPFFFLKSIQKISNRIKGHMDHTHQSVFHNGLIKLIICTVLQKKSRSWDHFLFWSGFPNEQEDQVKKILMNEQSIFVKRFKKELIDELVQDNV